MIEANSQATAMRSRLSCGPRGKSGKSQAEAVMTPSRWQEIERIYHANVLAEQYSALDGGAAALEKGGIVEEAEITDCVDHHDSPWFEGSYGNVLANARPLPFIPCRGMLGFFVPEVAKSGWLRAAPPR
jgi:hypothetical protein